MIANRQRGVRVSVAGLERFLAAVRRRLKIPRGAVGLCLVSDAQMARWNRTYRGKPRATDVLSFPAAEGGKGRRRGRVAAGDGRAYLGDIAIAPRVARRNARAAGRSLDEELRVLVLHGALHLLGYDHESDRGRMERVERRLRRELGVKA